MSDDKKPAPKKTVSKPPFDTTDVDVETAARPVGGVLEREVDKLDPKALMEAIKPPTVKPKMIPSWVKETEVVVNLKTKAEFAEVSRPLIRSALRALEREGKVKVRRHKSHGWRELEGAVVTAPDFPVKLAAMITANMLRGSHIG